MNRLASAVVALLVGCSGTAKDPEVFSAQMFPAPLAFLSEHAVQKEL